MTVKIILIAAVCICSLAVIITAINLVLVATGKNPFSHSVKHASAAPVFREYLDDIAAGRVEEAYRQDSAGRIDAALRGQAAPFISDDVAGRAGHITDVEVAGLTQNAETAAATARFSLGTRSYTSELTARWDDDAEAWKLTSTLANDLRVKYSTIHGEALGFTVAGAPRVEPASSVESYLAYPGVYDLAINVDPGTVAPTNSTPLTGERVIPPRGQYSTFTIAVEKRAPGT